METKNVKECYELLKNKECELIDVRSPEEHIEGRINFISKNLPLDEIKSWMKDLDKSKKYIIYCRSGGRSSFACQVLNDNGFNIINLSGGIMSWISEDLEITSN